jgi:hypothetical protein
MAVSNVKFALGRSWQTDEFRSVRFRTVAGEAVTAPLTCFDPDQILGGISVLLFLRNFPISKICFLSKSTLDEVMPTAAGLERWHRVQVCKGARR